MRYLVFAITILMLALGCQGGHCIKVGGTYEGIDGNLEYCFNRGQSEVAGVPAFDQGAADGSTTTLFGFTGETINQIIDKLKEKGKDLIGLQAPEKTHPVRQLKRILNSTEQAKARERP